MQHDDRFSMVAGGAAFLATATVFALSHLGGSVSPDRISPSHPSGERIAVAEAPRLEPEIEVVAASTPVEEVIAPEPEIVAVEHRPAPAQGDDGFQLSVAVIPGSSPDVSELLRLLSLSGPDVPGTAEVLVRRDADGRMVVASGTHRGYAALVDRYEALDVSRISVPQSLRGELSRAIDDLLTTPEAEVEPEMRSDGVAWTFSDPELASLDSAQRRLLLMGRGNAGIVRSKLEELRRELAPEVLRAVASDAPTGPDERVILATTR